MVFVKSIRGNTLVLDVTQDKTIKDVKSLIAFKESISVEDQRLLYAGNYFLLNPESIFVA